MSNPSPHDEQWAELVSLLAAGCLPLAEQPAVRQHLDACASCQQRFRELVVICDGLEASRPAVPECLPAISERVMSSISTSRPRPSILRVPWKLGLAAVVAASLVVAVTVGSLRWPRPPQPQPAHQPPPDALAGGRGQRLQTDETSAPPTLLVYERSFAQSSEAVESLLDREARRLSFLSVTNTPINRMKEALP